MIINQRRMIYKVLLIASLLIFMYFLVWINFETFNVLIKTIISEDSGIMTKRGIIIPGFILLMVSLSALIILLYKKSSLKIHWALFGLIALIALCLRVSWILLIPTVPESDFKVYHETAIQLAHGNFVNIVKPLGYPLILSISYRIFPNEIAGRFLNVFLSMSTVFLVYASGRLLSNRMGGLFAMLWMSMSPSEIYMSSVLCTEVITSTFVIGSITFFLYLINHPKKFNKILFIIPGFFLGYAVTIRPTTGLFFLVFILLILLKKNQEQKLIISIRLLAGMLIAPIIIVLWSSLNLHYFSMKSLFYDSFPLLSGTNIANNGSYSFEDARLYFSIPVEMRSEKVFEIAFARISKSEIPTLLNFFSNKVLRFITDNLYGTQWAFYSVELSLRADTFFSLTKWLEVIAQTWYWLAIFGTSVAMTWSFIERNQIWVFLISCILVAFIPHLILEVQSRYHHVLLPLFSLACGYLFWKMVHRIIFLKNHKANELAPQV